jgi:hypothetical protein
MEEITMKKQELILDLIRYLSLIDAGMQGFDEPINELITDNLVNALVGFGDEVIPFVHDEIEANKVRSFNHLIKVLEGLRHPTSIPILIDIHANYASYISGVACIVALREIGTDDCYLYLADVLNRCADGNIRVVNSGLELEIICKALGKWQDERALPSLKKAIKISDFGDRIPKAAIEALLLYPEGIKFLISRE